MANLTNKNIDFLSNQELIGILRPILNEIDIAASSEAHRSTTYLAASAIEGLFGELLDLLNIQPSPTNPWPTYRNGKPKKRTDLTFEEKERLLSNAGALPKHFKDLYSLVRGFRNYIHPEAELRKLEPIQQSVGQLALACLNALIEGYQSTRFISSQKWNLEYGQAQVPEDGVVHMPQNPGDPVSLLLSEQPASTQST